MTESVSTPPGRARTSSPATRRPRPTYRETVIHRGRIIKTQLRPAIDEPWSRLWPRLGYGTESEAIRSLIRECISKAG